MTNLWDELEHSVGEERPDGEADEVGQHFGEVRLLGEGDEEEAEQSGQVDHSDRQKPVTPHCHGRKQRYTLTDVTGINAVEIFKAFRSLLRCV